MSGLRARLAVLVALVATLVACAPDRAQIEAGLPAQWAGSGGADATDSSVRLGPDGAATLVNVPMWNGAGDCESTELPLYSGSATWDFDDGFTISAPDGATVLLLPTGDFGRSNWQEVGVGSCGADSSQSRIIFMTGGGPEGQLEDPW